MQMQQMRFYFIGFHLFLLLLFFLGVGDGCLEEEAQV
jgi:hypothetical protein